MSILRNKRLWLSDINTMNDFSEHHWAYEKFIEAVNLNFDSLEKSFVEELDGVVSATQLKPLPLISSFSADGDVLSQWRAYADEGRGVAIGFDAHLIDKLAIRSVEVEYDSEKQILYFSDILKVMNQVYKSISPEEERSEFMFDLGAKIGMDLSCFKNPAFQEEKEIRIIRAVNVNFDDKHSYLTDSGGNGEDRPSRRKQNIEFRAKSGGVVAYIELPIHGLGKGLIKDVIVGPKSPNDGVEVSMALYAAGFRDYAVRKSKATLR